MRDLALLLRNCNPVWNNRKRCSKCGERKYLSEFSPNSRSKDGAQSACKSCCNSSRRANG